jgi:Ni,Fe-hydrogenase III component G
MGKEILEKIKEKFSSQILNIFERSPRRIYIDINPENIKQMAEFIFRVMGGRFAIATGIDTPEGIEILYHFSFDSIGMIVSLRTRVARENPEIESITTIIKGAEWIEREIWELLGVRFKNHPNLKRLLLSEDWPEGKYPLRREE